MSFSQPKSWRISIGLFFTALGAFTVVGSFYAVAVQHYPAVVAAVVALGGCALYGYMGYSGGAKSWVRADEQQVGFYPALGKPKVVQRSRLASMVRVQVPRASAVEFRAHDGTVLLTVDSWFGRENFERLAAYLDLPLQWKI